MNSIFVPKFLKSADSIFPRARNQQRKDQTGPNSRSRILTLIPLPTSHSELLAIERVAIDVAHSPVQNATIRAGPQNQLGSLVGPELVRLGNSQAVADADDGALPLAARAVDLQRADCGFRAVDVRDENGFGAVVEHGVVGDGVGGCGEGEEGGQEGGDEVHGCLWLRVGFAWSLRGVCLV